MHLIYIDADACPVKDEIYRVARRYEMRVLVVAKFSMWTPTDPLVELIVHAGFGAVDDWITEQAAVGDIVISADIPLAARCLAKEAKVLDPRGKPFSEARHRLFRPGHARTDGPICVRTARSWGARRR